MDPFTTTYMYHQQMINCGDYLHSAEHLRMITKPEPKVRDRTRFCKRQLEILENAFNETHYPDMAALEGLAHQLDVTECKIRVWFQNRRAGFRREQNQASLSNRRRVRLAPISAAPQGERKVADESSEETDQPNARQQPVPFSPLFSPGSSPGFSQMFQFPPTPHIQKTQWICHRGQMYYTHYIQNGQAGHYVIADVMRNGCALPDICSMEFRS